VSIGSRWRNTKWYWAFHPDTMIHHDTKWPITLIALADMLFLRRLRGVPPFNREAEREGRALRRRQSAKWRAWRREQRTKKEQA